MTVPSETLWMSEVDDLLRAPDGLSAHQRFTFDDMHVRPGRAEAVTPCVRIAFGPRGLP